MQVYLSKPDEIFRQANTSTRKRNFKLWIATQIFVRSNPRKYAYLANYYLRWVDDKIDNPDICITDKQVFLSRQYMLLESFINNKSTELNDFEENYLYYLVKYSKDNNRTDIINLIKTNLDAFALDIHRLENGGSFTFNELHQYLNLLLPPVYFLTIIFTLPKFKIKNQMFVGKFFYYVLSLRDFTEDLNAGYINVCKEDIIKYKINLENISEDSNLVEWAKELYKETLNILNEELEILHQAPLLVRMLWFPGFVDQYMDLIIIKKNGFRITAEQKTSFISKVKIFIEASIKGLKMFKIVFL